MPSAIPLTDIPDKCVTTLNPACPIIPLRSATSRQGFQEEGHMEKASKGVAWVCIFSTLLLDATALGRGDRSS